MKRFFLILFTLLSCVSIYGAKCPVSFEEAPAYDVCLTCHEDRAYFPDTDKAISAKEKAFIKRTFQSIDHEFGAKNCSGCHISSCTDCHAIISGAVSKPDTDTCLNCHNDLYTGADFAGLGIREDHERYRRGVEFKDEFYMKMLPDIHYEKGMTCTDCHDMASAAGIKQAKQCLDCHEYSVNVLDHSISGHGNVACVSCHGAWASHEYGSFFVRTIDSTAREYFRWVKYPSDEYVKSSFMRSNEPFALGIKEGIYVPIKPKFIVFTTYVYKNRVVGIENEMLSNRWAAFTPHTVRKETPLCHSCHDNRRKYLLENSEDRFLYPDRDGLPIKSFYSSEKFQLEGAEFVTEEEYIHINTTKSPEYTKAYIKKLEQLKKLFK